MVGSAGVVDWQVQVRRRDTPLSTALLLAGSGVVGPPFNCPGGQEVDFLARDVIGLRIRVDVPPEDVTARHVTFWLTPE